MDIEACQCDCGVGEPPNAHCKHVVALLLTVEQLKRESKIILHTTCTQRLQSFHKPKAKEITKVIGIRFWKLGAHGSTTSISLDIVSEDIIVGEEHIPCAVAEAEPASGRQQCTSSSRSVASLDSESSGTGRIVDSGLHGEHGRNESSSPAE